MAGPGGSLFKRPAAPSSWLPPDGDVQLAKPSVVAAITGEQKTHNQGHPWRPDAVLSGL